MVKARQVARIGVSVALMRRGDRALMLVKRGRPPAKDMWAFAGGKVEFGEELLDAAVRELREETGISVPTTDLTFQRPVEIIVSDQDQPISHFVLMCYSSWIGDDATPIAADDATDVGFFSLDEMRAMNVTPSTLELAEALVKQT
ncbi:MAG: NUDIX hydrolase [Pseudomonadota bacterium]